ncbi:MAG: TRAP transporter substrate-binding protein DctP [Candidatus Methylomirabilia bacterium]
MSCFWSKARFAAAAVLVAALLATPPGSAAGAATVVKLATLAPEGSAWYKLLERMGEDWRKATGGAVTLRIYPGGVVGDEETMIRKMRVGQLQAATVTGLGLASLDKSFYALLVPMMFADDGELDRVRERLAPLLEQQLARQGFVVLAWGDAGWISFFTKRPVTRPAQAMATKLFVGTDDSTVVQLYKETGFNPVQVSAMDILPGLQTGLLDAFAATPLAALAFQWFALAPNMTDLRFAALTGATIIDRRTWEKIPAALRPKIMAASRASEAPVKEEVRRLNAEAVGVMTKNGLKISRVSAEVQAEWARLLEGLHGKIRGPIVPEAAFDAALAARDDYRAEQAKGSGAR